VHVGQEVGRDHRYRSEQTFVKLISNADSMEAAEKIRKDWTETRLNQPGGPTVLPMRIEDLPSLPGSELAGLMPRRGDFDIEWDNDAENVLADMEFTMSDSPQERELKIKVIQIYNSKLDERDRRKTFLLSRGLLDYRKNQQADAKLPRDERDLVRRMRLFERLHSPEEHKLFPSMTFSRPRDFAKRFAQLQMYRRMGIQTLVEAEKYENDKARREIHKMSYLQKEAESEKAEAVRSTSAKDAPASPNTRRG
jgi:transcriptional adapter 2-alpha